MFEIINPSHQSMFEVRDLRCHQNPSVVRADLFCSSDGTFPRAADSFLFWGAACDCGTAPGSCCLEGRLGRGECTGRALGEVMVMGGSQPECAKRNLAGGFPGGLDSRVPEGVHGQCPRTWRGSSPSRCVPPTRDLGTAGERGRRPFGVAEVGGGLEAWSSCAGVVWPSRGDG